MEPDEILRIFDDIVEGYLFLIKALIARLDENIIIPIMLPKIEEELIGDHIDDQKKEEIIKLFKTFLSIIRGAMPNYVQKLMSEDLGTKKPRFENIVKNKLTKTDDEIVISLLTYLLIDLWEGSTRPHVKNLMNNEGSFSKTTLFFKIIQILSNDYNLSEGDQKYLKKSATKLIVNNKNGLAERLQLFADSIR